MANPMFYDDDFDFGGDDGDDNAKQGAKRTFMELEDDDEDVDLYPAKKMYASTVVGNDHATTTILNLRASLEERDSTISKLKKDLNKVNGDVEQWRSTFQIESLLPLITNPGVFYYARHNSYINQPLKAMQTEYRRLVELNADSQEEPDVVLEAFQKVQASEVQLKEQLLSAKRREGAMLVKLAGKEQELVDLKSMVHDLRLMLKPPMLQARRLLLDPAIHAEFTRMKKELEAAEKRVKELQDDLAAVQFTPHSKNGKMLMAKCRTLQEENEEIGREASEGKMHELGTKLAMQKSLTVELRRGYQELFEYVEDLNYEAERSQQTIYLLQRQIQQKDHQIQLHLVEQSKQAEVREANIKTREEDRTTQLEAKRDAYGGDEDSRDKLSGESKRR